MFFNDVSVLLYRGDPLGVIYVIYMPFLSQKKNNNNYAPLIILEVTLTSGDREYL